MFLLWVLLLHPAAAWQAYRRLARGEPIGPKIYRFRLSFYLILFSTLTALAVAGTNQLSLTPATSGASVLLGIVVAAVFGYAGTRRGSRVSPAQQERIRLLYAPTDIKEWIWAVWVGLCAGIGEEIVYRCVLFQILVRVTSSAGMAVAICVLTFALAHLPQGKSATYGVALLGLSFHFLYFLSGGLAAPMVAHAVYDVVILTVLYRREIRCSQNMALRRPLNEAILTTPEQIG